MQVLICSPYRVDKNLGKAYNEAMRLLPDDWWACFTDIDTLFLTPDCGKILHEYATRYPDAGILTCYTNRISLASKKQLLGQQLSENPNIKDHIAIAESKKELLYTVSPINRSISGFLMMISKRTWLQYPFSESGLCLDVDTHYSRKIRIGGKPILRMNGLYVFHTYRLMNGIYDKTHLY